MLVESISGALMNKIPEAAYRLLEGLAYNNYQRASKRSKPRLVARVIKLNVASQIATIN